VSPECHIEFSRQIGDLYSHLMDQYNHKQYPDLLIVSNEVQNGKRIGLDGQDGTVRKIAASLVHTKT